MGAFTLAIVAPLLIFLFPPESQNKKLSVPVTLPNPLSRISSGNGVRFNAPSETGFVMADGGGDNSPGAIAFAGWAIRDLSGALHVFAVNCSHLGCSVNLSTQAQQFQCPCHGSQFALDGSVVHGPAQYPLSHLTYRQGSSSDQIVIDGVQLKGIG